MKLCVLQESYPLLYASVDALTMGDVKRLLDQYKELVIKHESLKLVSASLHAYL
jgi:hypothetical protein